MGLFTNKEFNSFEDLFFDQLEDLYDAENQILVAIPKMADACSSSELKTAFQDHHLRESKLSAMKGP